MQIVNPVGKRGEDLATAYLQEKGYKMLERNYRKQYAEIDIIALSPDNCLVFVEVKTRTSRTFGTPFEAITYRKLKPLTQAALYYQMTHKDLPRAMRIDAVAVELGKKGAVVSVEHIENISTF